MRACKYRIYPNAEQKVLIEKHFGCSCYAYNWALFEKAKHDKENGKNLSKSSPSGKYFASVLVDDSVANSISTTIELENTIGIEVGLAQFLIDSDGNKTESPKFLKLSRARLKNIKGMAKNHKLARLIQDASWGRFFQYWNISVAGMVRI